MPQSELSRKAAISQHARGFSSPHGRTMKDARILLVDDVLTTGATCSEAARILKKAGAAMVAVAVVARAQGRE